MLDYGRFKLIDITTPSHGATVYLNKYWQVIDGIHQAVFYGVSPQCNSDKAVMEHLHMSRDNTPIEQKFGGKSIVVFVPVAYFFDERKYD